MAQLKSGSTVGGLRIADVDTFKRTSNYIKTADATLLAAEVSHAQISNLGQTSEMELTLPPAAEGYDFTFRQSTPAQSVKFFPNASDNTYLNSVAIGEGVEISNNGGSSNVGDAIRYTTFLIGVDTWAWAVEVLSGTWNSGGA